MSEKFLVTGACGFIGSHVFDTLVSRGYEPVVIDLLTYAGDVSRVNRGRYSFYHADIADTDLVSHIVQNHRITTILNLAAETHVDNSILDSRQFVHTNVDGVRSLLDVCRKRDVRLVHVSTDEVYGPSGRVPFDETASLSPQNPYAASKAAADLLIQSYRNTFGIRSVVIRPSNNFGPRQHAEKFIPTIVSSALSGRKIPIYGDGRQKRQWTYVKDCAISICDIAVSSKSEIVNVASSTVQENVQIATRIIEIMGVSHDLLQHVTDRPGHDREYWITSHQHVIKNETVFDDALRETVKHTVTRLGSAV